MSKRTEVRRVIIALGLALILAGCSSANSQEGSSDNPSRTTLEIAMDAVQSSLAPYNTVTGEIISGVIFMALLETNEKNEVTSNILSSWSASDDAQTITLTLKSDLEWSDGTPLTSADIIMSLTQYLDSNISIHAGRIGGVVGQAEYVAGSAASISGLAAQDDLTVTIQLVETDAAWLPNLATVGRLLPILPSHILADVPHSQLIDHEFFRTLPVSSGPYQLVEYIPDQHISLEQNPNWSLGTPGFERVLLRFVAPDVMSARLETGEVQMAYTVTPTDAERLTSIDGIEIQSISGVAPHLWSLMYDEPLLDPRVRQAMVYAVDREGICEEALAGYCTVPETNVRQIGPSWAIPTDDMIEYRYDPERARDLLADANWDSSTELTFFNILTDSDSKRALEIAQANMADVGINWSVIDTTGPELLESLERGATDLQGFSITGANFSVDPSAVQEYTTCDARFPAGANTNQYCDAELDKIWIEGRKVTDQEQRAAIYQDAFRRLNHNPPEINLFVQERILARDARLKGVQAHPTGNHLWNIGEWYWEE